MIRLESYKDKQNLPGCVLPRVPIAGGGENIGATRGDRREPKAEDAANKGNHVGTHPFELFRGVFEGLVSRGGRKVESLEVQLSGVRTSDS